MVIEQETFSGDNARLRSIPVDDVGNLPEQGFDGDQNTRIDTAVERGELLSEPGFSTPRRAHGTSLAGIRTRCRTVLPSIYTLNWAKGRRMARPGRCRRARIWARRLWGVNDSRCRLVFHLGHRHP